MWNKSVVIVDDEKAPLFIDISAAHTHDSRLLPPLLQFLKTSKKARILAADAAFDSKKLASICAKKHTALLAANNPRKSRITYKYRPYRRWIIERTFGWFSWFRGVKPCRSTSYISCVSLFQISAAIIIGRML